MSKKSNARKNGNSKNSRSSSKSSWMSPNDINELIKKKAYEIYCKRGNFNGDPTSDWLKAERQVRQELRTR